MEKDYQCTITKIENGYLLFYKNMINGKFQYLYCSDIDEVFKEIKEGIKYL